MVPSVRRLNFSLASLRATPSPASMRYGVPLTMSRFDDWARLARGTGPPAVPSVLSRVPALGAGDCAALCLAGTTRPLMMKPASNHGDGLCIVSPGSCHCRLSVWLRCREYHSAACLYVMSQSILRGVRRLVTLRLFNKENQSGRRPMSLIQMRTLLSTSLLASLLASVSFAAEAGTITGTVKNADGTPF